jgi:hypothetical protein
MKEQSFHPVNPLPLLYLRECSSIEASQYTEYPLPNPIAYEDWRT